MKYEIDLNKFKVLFSEYLDTNPFINDRFINQGPEDWYRSTSAAITRCVYKNQDLRKNILSINGNSQVVETLKDIYNSNDEFSQTFSEQIKKTIQDVIDIYVLQNKLNGDKTEEELLESLGFLRVNGELLEPEPVEPVEPEKVVKA